MQINKVNLEPALYLVSTPIGNLRDITIRALETLSSSDIIYCEDTRVTKKLLNNYAIDTKLNVYNDHSDNKVRERIIADIQAGKAVALVSDAGTPLISDPGYKLVRTLKENNIKVIPIVGASSVIGSLSISGLQTDNFYFEGFLPQKQGSRQNRLKELKAINTTLIFMESPNRLTKTLADMLEVFGNIQANVTRELTKMFEESNLNTMQNLLEYYTKNPPKGEIIILLDNPANNAQQLTEEEIIEELKKLKAKLSVKDAAKVAEETLNISKKKAYQILLEI